MKIFKRPLAVCCAAFVASFAAAYFLSELITVFIVTVGALSLLSLFLLAFIKGHSRRRVLLTLAIAGAFSVCAMLLSYRYFVTVKNSTVEFYNRDVELSGVCTSVSSGSSFNTSYTVRTSEIDGKVISADILFLSGDTRLAPGDGFIAKVRLRSLSDGTLGFNECEVYEGRGIIAAAELCEGESVERTEETTEWYRVLYTLRGSTVRRFRSCLGDRGAALFAAAFVGDRSLIDDADSLSVRRSGTSHLLAVSGMHFSVVMSVVLIFLAAFGVPLKLRYVLLSVAAIAYVAFTGFSAPVIRCGIMLLFSYVGAVAGKNSDSLTALLCSAVIMLAAGPYNLLSVSFWLSFSATLGIVLITPSVQRLLSRPHRRMAGDIMRDDRYTVPLRVILLVRELACGFACSIPLIFAGAVAVSVAAIAFSLPFTILFFGNVSHASLLSGIILSPVVSAVLVLSPVILLFGGITPISSLGSALGEAFFTITNYFSDMDGVCSFVDYPLVRIGSVLFILAILICLAVSKRRITAFILSAVMIPALIFSANICEAAVFAQPQAAASCAGDADCMAFRSEGGLIITDMGSSDKTDIGKALSACSVLGENEISAYIFTGVSARQANVVRYLLTNSRVDTVYLPDYAARNMSVLCDAAEEEARALGAEVRYFRFGESFSIGEYTVCVSELEYLPRSSVPVYSVSVDHEEGSVIWLSSAFFEGDKHTSLYGESYDTVIFGSYGPKYKEALTDELSNIGCGRYILGAESILDFAAHDGSIIGAADGTGYTVSEICRFTLDPAGAVTAFDKK